MGTVKFGFKFRRVFSNGKVFFFILFNIVNKEREIIFGRIVCSYGLRGSSELMRKRSGFLSARILQKSISYKYLLFPPFVIISYDVITKGGTSKTAVSNISHVAVCFGSLLSCRSITGSVSLPHH